MSSRPSRARRLAVGTLLAAFLALVLLPSSAAAQPDRSRDKRAKVEARRAEIRARVLKEVGIDEKKGKEVEKVLRKYEPERQKLMREQRAQKDTLRELLKKDSDDEQAYKKAVDALRAARKKLHAVQEQELDELGKLLTAKQQAKLFAALQRLRRQLAKRRAQEQD